MRASCSGSSAIASSATSTSMPVAGDELVDEVEVGLGPPVELDHAAVAHHQRGRRVVGAGERDQPEVGVLGDEVVAADGARREERGAQRRCLLLLHGAERTGWALRREASPPGPCHAEPWPRPAPCACSSDCPLRPEPARDLEAWTREHAAAAGGACRRPTCTSRSSSSARRPRSALPAIGEALRETCADVHAPAYVLARAAAARLRARGGAGAARRRGRAARRAQDALAQRLERVESRPWLPHVTLGRARAARRGRRVPDSAPPPLELDLAEVVLFVVGALAERRPRTGRLPRFRSSRRTCESDAFDSHESPSAAAPDGS